MKLRYKILNGIAAVLLVGIAALLITLSYEKDCPAAPAQAVTPDAGAMRAVTQRCYGDPANLRVENVARPVPADDQVLIKVRASSVNPAEWHMVTGKPYILRMDRGIGAPHHDGKGSRVGFDMAGTVEAVGSKVTAFKVGDEVFGGVGGALSDYVVARERQAVVAKPTNMSFEEAAGLPIAAITALQGLRDHGKIKAGQKVLINGASGGVGTYAVQIAKAFGAEVTGVCSTRNVAMVKSLGADHVVDYTQADFTNGAVKYDLILDNVGNHRFSDLLGVMTPTGTIVTVSGSKSDPFLGPIWRVIGMKLKAHFVEQTLTFFVASVNKADLEVLATFVRDGRLRTIIDRRYRLEQAGEALGYIGSQRARGKVIVTF